MTDNLQIHVSEADALRAHVAELHAENKRLQGWVNDLQSGMYINCVYCGHRSVPAEDTPVAMGDVLKEHIEQCSRHPMTAFGHPDRNWPADFAHENGCYICRCCDCGEEFVGHKRRVVCRACADATLAKERGGAS